MSEKWDNYFLRIALEVSSISRDPNTHVGAVLVGCGREILSTGFNGFPTGIADTPNRLNDRAMKNRIIVHAERNAICLAARRGIATRGATLYVMATDDSGIAWGGAPCVQCTLDVIQAGITHIVTAPFKNVPSRWIEDIAAARSLLDEAGICYREIELPPDLSKGSFY